jgi:hypothetical protein
LLSELPNIESGERSSGYEHEPYRVDPYIKAAVALQSVDRVAALERLHALARSEDQDQDWPTEKVIVLCRMLFTKRPGSDFRGPAIGAPVFLGGTVYSDWPLEPTESVDGVPFVILRGYQQGGRPESNEQYLEYCEANCDWSAFHYTVKTKREERDALNKLIASPKWKTPLKAYECQFLAGQIQ